MHTYLHVQGSRTTESDEVGPLEPARSPRPLKRAKNIKHSSSNANPKNDDARGNHHRGRGSKLKDQKKLGFGPDGSEKYLADACVSPHVFNDESNQNISVLMDSVIKVFCVHSEPNFSLPWQRKRQYTSSGSGFIISGRRILTNAHCVDHHTQVKVKRRGSDVKYVATVLSIGTECDIALLAVKEEGFWKDLVPLEFGELPHLQDAVTVCGYPVGGDTMSVTQGVVSRIEVTPYVHGATELLGIQVDAAINAGSSGGPAFNGKGQCVGIAFQSLRNEDVENTSYIIPTPVVLHFITDYERHGRYTGFPALGVEWQKMESPALRESFGLNPAQRGVLVRRTEPTSAVATVLKRGDVLLTFDGVEIGVDGTVPFRSGERIGFSYLVSQKMSGDEAELGFWSQGRLCKASIPLRPPTRLIPVHINNRPPSYYIFGGLVFTPVTVPLLKSEFGKDYDYEAPVKILEKMLHGMAENEKQQIVVLSQVLAADINVGYEEIGSTQVLRANDIKINNLEDLVNIIEKSTGKYITLDLEYEQVIVLDREEAKKATPDVLQQHCIDFDRSTDLLVPPASKKPSSKRQSRRHK